MLHRISVSCVLVVLAFAANGWCQVADSSLEKVEKEITEKASAYKSIQFKQKSTTEVVSGDMNLKTSAESTVEYVRKPADAWASRAESKMRTVTKTKEGEKKQDSEVLSICDGKYVYILSKMPEMTSAMKIKADPKTQPSPFDPKAMFKVMRRDYDLKLLADEKVDGKDTYVIQATPRKKDDNKLAESVSKIVTCYDKKTGLGLKSLVYDPTGKVTTTAITSDIKTDVTLPDDRFVFKAPEGVQVVDMTQQADAASQPVGASAQSSDGTSKSTSEDKPKQNASSEKPSEPAAKKKDNSGAKAAKDLLKAFR